MLLVSVVLTVFGVIGVGAALRRANWLTADADDSLLRLVIGLLLPCFIFQVITDNPNLRDPMSIWPPPVVGLLSIALGVAVGAAWTKAFGKLSGLENPAQARTFAVCSGIFNYGYIPIPLVQTLFDQQTLGTLLLHNVGVEIGVWTVGLFALTGGFQPGWWRKVISPPAIAMVVALMVNMLGLTPHLPAPLVNGIHLLAPSAIPLGILMIGAIMADHFQWRDMGLTGPGRRVILASVLLRLGLIPVGMIAAAVLLPMSIELKRVIVIEAAMPAAVFPVVMAKHYGGDPRTALRVIVGTSVIALLTVPLLLQAGFRLIGE
ncbi:MAG: AEC family transporter [Phycisphaeraceae bacterium]|nr:AEC family transporter [Phycisphaeraceae bacterium]